MRKVNWQNTSKKIVQDWKKYGRGILVSAGVLGVFALLGKGICPIARVFGIPCPGCGITRSILLLLQGKWKLSWYMQPFAQIWILFLIAAVERYILNRNGKWKIIGIIIILIGMLGYYIWKMTTVFPMQEPYIYLTGNLMEKIVPEYQTIFLTLSY